ncbi:MAG: response regulator [Muribaculaceae bacterium]|nr:response regulator [Muribaculaceae bacterium]
MKENGKRIRCVILEDDYYPAIEVESIVRKSYPEYEILNRFENGAQLADFIQKENADLIISDVILADGSVLDVFREHEIKTPVIFISAQEKHREEGRRFNMIGYRSGNAEPDIPCRNLRYPGECHQLQ